MKKIINTLLGYRISEYSVQSGCVVTVMYKQIQNLGHTSVLATCLSIINLSLYNL